MFSLFSLLLYVFIDVRLSHLNKDYLLTSCTVLILIIIITATVLGIIYHRAFDTVSIDM